MALEKKTILMRRGFLADLDMSRLQAGEFAVCIDPAVGQKRVFICLGNGIVKELGTFEEFETTFADLIQLSKSYAIGDTGVRPGENEDNSKYYSERSKEYKEIAELYKEIAEDLFDVHIERTSVVGPIETWTITYNGVKSVEFEIKNSTTDLQLYIDDDGDIAQI